MLVSYPEYLGWASILQEIILDRSKLFQILQISGVFPLLVIEIAVFVADCPDYSGYSSGYSFRLFRKHGFGLD